MTIKRNAMFAMMLAALGIGAIAVAGQQSATQQTNRQDQPTNQRDDVQQATQRPGDDPDRFRRNERSADTQAGRLDERTSGPQVRVSKLLGMNIQNNQNENVGEISDLVVDSRTGEIKYAAVTYGGFLGVGDKLFAVPFNAFQYKTNPEDADETIVVLDVTQQKLEGAKGFNEENWPNFADRNFTDEVDQRYGVERQRERRIGDRRGRIGGGVDPDNVDDVEDRNRPQGQTDR